MNRTADHQKLLMKIMSEFFLRKINTKYQYIETNFTCTKTSDNVAEWSKAHVSGTCLNWRGFESLHCHTFYMLLRSFPSLRITNTKTLPNPPFWSLNNTSPLPLSIDSSKSLMMIQNWTKEKFVSVKFLEWSLVCRNIEPYNVTHLGTFWILEKRASALCAWCHWIRCFQLC